MIVDYDKNLLKRGVFVSLRGGISMALSATIVSTSLHVDWPQLIDRQSISSLKCARPIDGVYDLGAST